MLLPLRQFPFKSHPIRRLLLGCLLIGGGICWIGADRVPANATRPTSWQGKPSLEALPGHSFRIASFNIHGGKGADHQLNLDRIASCIKEVRPRFVGLNEVHGTCFGTRLNQAEELGKQLEMASQFIPTERRFWQPSFGNGLLTQVATSPVHKLPLPCTQGKKYRTAALTSFRIGGQSVRVLCVHLDRVQDRETQLERVFSLFCDLESPAILMGDFNTFPHDPLLKKWLDNPEIHDAIGEKLGADASAKRIDWIFTRGLIAVDAGLLENDASDHPLAWAELKLPAASERKRQRAESQGRRGDKSF